MILAFFGQFLSPFFSWPLVFFIKHFGTSDQFEHENIKLRILRQTDGSNFTLAFLTNFCLLFFQLATRITSFFIEHFGMRDLFGRENYEYYAKLTGRILKVEDEWIFFTYPPASYGSSSTEALDTTLDRGREVRNLEGDGGKYTQYLIIRNGHIRNSAEFLGKFKKRALGRSNLRNASKNLRNGQCSDFQS